MQVKKFPLVCRPRHGEAGRPAAIRHHRRRRFLTHQWWFRFFWWEWNQYADFGFSGHISTSCRGPGVMFPMELMEPMAAEAAEKFTIVLLTSRGIGPGLPDERTNWPGQKFLKTFPPGRVAQVHLRLPAEPSAGHHCIAADEDIRGAAGGPANGSRPAMQCPPPSCCAGWSARWPVHGQPGMSGWSCSVGQGVLLTAVTLNP
jgi:hypothetical protein